LSHGTSSRPLVLLADEEPKIRRLARRFLERADFEVAEASDGAETIELFSTLHPQLVLLDVQMPDMDGFEVCRRLRQIPGGSQTPIMMITAQDDSETVQRSYESGVTDFVTKPVNWIVLGHRARHIIEADHTRRNWELSRQRLDQTERVAHLGSWVLELPSKRLVVSSQSLQIFGLSTEPGQPAELDDVLALLDATARERLEAAIEHSIATHEDFEVEHPLLLADGTERHLRQSGSVEVSPGQAYVLRGIVHDITPQKEAEAKIQKLSHFDALTELPNRSMLVAILEQALARSARTETLVAVLHFDIDRFKEINLSFGQRAGDRLLQRIADRLRLSLRREDYLSRDSISDHRTLARPGGDDFIVVLSDLDDLHGVTMVARRTLEILAESFHVEGQEVFISASLGISVTPPDSNDAAKLLQQAEAAMFYAKQQDRNTYHFYSDTINIAARKKLELESGLHHAIEREELYLHYQPLLSVGDEKMVGAEALLRWQQGGVSPVQPSEFIPVAEDAGLMLSIGSWVLRTACEQIATWREAGLPPLRISVNLSVRQLADPHLIEKVRTTLEETKADPSGIIIELTERGVVDNDPVTLGQLSGLRDLGLALAVDDFGTGHSALSYLRSFPIDVLKIDRSFVSGIEENSKDSAIVSGVIAMAHRLGLKVVAEGVETQEQLDFLRRESCDEVQGYFFARPKSTDEITALLSEMNS